MPPIARWRHKMPQTASIKEYNTAKHYGDEHEMTVGGILRGGWLFAGTFYFCGPPSMGRMKVVLEVELIGFPQLIGGE